MKSFGKIIDLLILFILTQLIPILSAMFTNFLNPIIHIIDNDGAFLWISVHHIFQLILTLVAMKIYFNRPLKELGFNLDNKKYIMKIIIGFIIVYLGIKVLVWMIFIINKGNVDHYFVFPASFKNILGYWSFEAFISGTCEEPLFRGLVITILLQSWKGNFRVRKMNISEVMILSAILFALAHISFSVFPFKIIQIDPVQLLATFLLGLFYAHVFQKTKSLLGPILLHNLSNIITITIPIIILFTK